MKISSAKQRSARPALNRELVLRTALQLADEGGLESLSMRKLGRELGVEAMAIYYYFANKEQVLDGIVDLVWSEVEVPVAGVNWKSAMRRRAISLREALGRHRWSVGLMESRRDPGPANLGHHDAVLGNLRAAGFTVEMAAHAYSLLDSYIYGFALTKMNLPFETRDDIAQVSQTMLQPFPIDQYPNMVEILRELVGKPGYDFEHEFLFGLDLALEGLERLAPTS